MRNKKVSFWTAIVISFHFFLPSTHAQQKKADLPANIASGSQYGVISSSPSVNQIAFHWLKQEGSVWDALVAVMFQLLLDAPHIVSFDSDVSLMVVKRGSPPQLYWLSNFDDLDPDKTHFFPYSRWPKKILAFHDAFPKFTLDQLLALPILKAKSGWQIPREFQNGIKRLKKVHFLNKRLKAKKLTSPSLANQLQAIALRNAWFLKDEKTQKTVLDNKKRHLSEKQRKEIKKKLRIPSKKPWVYQAQIPLGPAQLYGADSMYLRQIRARLDLLSSMTYPEAVKQTKYLTRIEKAKLKPPYKETFQMVLFDKYGQAVALSVGIPNILTAYGDDRTDTLAHTAYTQLKERFWSLSPFCIWEKEAGILALIAPQKTEPASFLTSFPLLLDILKQKKHQFVELLDTPQYHKVSDSKLLTTHASKAYEEAFKKVKTFDPPTRYIGLEVLPNRVLGFTSKENPTLPLMH